MKIIFFSLYENNIIFILLVGLCFLRALDRFHAFEKGFKFLKRGFYICENNIFILVEGSRF